MGNKKYKNLVAKYTPKENVLYNSVLAFFIGGIMGMIGQGLIDIYSYIFNLPKNESATLMIITLVFLGCFLTCLGFFDKWVNFARCGLIVPITGFAHAMMSAALEYKKEGLVTGIGACMLKLAGSVIIFGVISAYIFGLLRFIIMGG